MAPPGRYGALLMQDDRVTRFSEKPPGDNAVINGGFFVLHPDVLERIEGDARHPLNFVFRSDHNQTVQALVASGVGSALVPRLTMDEEDETTVLIEPPKVQPRLISLAWHRDHYRTPRRGRSSKRRRPSAPSWSTSRSLLSG